jgi:hypothetical protein
MNIRNYSTNRCANETNFILRAPCAYDKRKLADFHTIFSFQSEIAAKLQWAVLGHDFLGWVEIPLEDLALGEEVRIVRPCAKGIR